jgi:hypothetical protein
LLLWGEGFDYHRTAAQRPFSVPTGTEGKGNANPKIGEAIADRHQLQSILNPNLPTKSPTDGPCDCEPNRPVESPKCKTGRRTNNKPSVHSSGRQFIRNSEHTIHIPNSITAHRRRKTRRKGGAFGSRTNSGEPRPGGGRQVRSRTDLVERGVGE